MSRLHQRAFAHPARAPQQGIVGRQPSREALGIGDQDVTHLIDSLEQLQSDAVDVCHRLQGLVRSMPDERVSPLYVCSRRFPGRQAFERCRDALG